MIKEKSSVFVRGSIESKVSYQYFYGLVEEVWDLWVIIHQKIDSIKQMSHYFKTTNNHKFC
jgi:hypothetical protein